MKRNLILATLLTVLAGPTAFSKTEVEMLRALCSEQERQILKLEEENSRLRSDSSEKRPATDRIDLISTAISKPAASAGSSKPTAATERIYVVQAGDSFPKISKKTGVPEATLASLNGIKPNAVIHPGQKLKLPAVAGAPAAQVAAVEAPVQKPQPSQAIHTVQSGDTFFSIAKKHGMSTAALIAANPSVKPAALRLGQQINLGTASKTTASTPPAAAAAPAPAAAPAHPEKPVTKQAAAPGPEKRIRPVMIEGEMTYGAFAAQHGTDAERLNALNGLDLTTATVLAKGSELYVPATR